MNRQRTGLRVDAARFYLFHPEDHANAGDFDPSATALAEGLVVGLRLGADGQRNIEVTGVLDESDRADVGSTPLVFPLRVRHGKLFATDRIAALDDYNWAREEHVAIPNGTYRVSWFAVHEEAITRRNTNWIVLLEPVPSLDGIATWPALPHEDTLTKPV